ncbi:MFS transporter [Aestuariibius sp. 2305UL40-4]|uniref:MFS transporter n=1 Tax=Aestuariibius violaceus TaxID=3234132 RepID=UPI00345EDE65
MRAAGLKLTLLFGASLTVMSAATISPSLPAIRDQFADVENIEVLARLLLTLPALFIAITAPLSGWVIDRFGRLRVLLTGAVLFALSGMSGLILDSIPALLVGRAFLGISVGLMMPTVTTLAGDYFAGAERARYLGQQAAFMGLGGLVFVSSGGFLADLDWRAPFAIYGASLIMIPMVLAFLTEPVRERLSAPTDGSGRIPLIVPVIYGAAFFAMVAFYMVPTQLPFLLQTALGIPEASRAGLAIGMAMLFSSVASLAYGRFAGRLPFAGFMGVSFGLMAVSYAVIWVSTSYGMVMAAMIGIGIGMGLIFPTLTTTLLGAAPEHIRGRLSGGLTASVFSGQFVSPILSQSLVPVAGGLPAVFGLFAVMLAVVALLAALLAIRPAGGVWNRARARRM